MTLLEGITEVFRDMPSIGLLKDDAYRYLIKNNSSILNKIDKSEFDTERVADPENPRYFTRGPKKSTFQIPDRIIPNKTKLYIKIDLSTADNRVYITIGMNVTGSLDVIGKEIEPYHNKKPITIDSFINDWNNNRWSAEINSAVNHFRNQTGVSKNSEELEYKLEDADTLDKLCKVINLDKSDLAKEILKSDNQKDIDNTREVEKSLDSLYLSNKFGLDKYLNYINKEDLSHAGKDLLDNRQFIEDITDAFKRSLGQ